MAHWTREKGKTQYVKNQLANCMSGFCAECEGRAQTTDSAPTKNHKTGEAHAAAKQCSIQPNVYTRSRIKLDNEIHTYVRQCIEAFSSSWTMSTTRRHWPLLMSPWSVLLCPYAPGLRFHRKNTLSFTFCKTRTANNSNP